MSPPMRKGQRTLKIDKNTFNGFFFILCSRERTQLMHFEIREGKQKIN
jgi:hypothetical protein